MSIYIPERNPAQSIHLVSVMKAVKYSRLPMADDEDSLTFDYTSAFSYEDKDFASLKYKSVFTYGNTTGSSPPHNEPKTSTDRAIWILVICGYFIIYLLTFPVLIWFSLKKLEKNERIVVFRLGRLYKSKGPGWVFVFPLLDRYHRVDVRLKAFSVPPKQVITEDGGIIEVGAEIYFQVKNVEKSVTNVQNLNQSTRILMQTLLCNMLSQKTLSEIEAERRAIASKLQETSNKVCADWGLAISRVELSQTKILSEPPVKKLPTMMMPPGLFAMAGGAAAGGGGDPGAQAQLPAALAHLVGALASAQDGSPGQAVSEALQAFTQPNRPCGMPPMNPSSFAPSLVPPSPPTGNPSQTYDTTVFLSTPKLSPEEIVTSIREALSPELVEKVRASFQFDIAGPGGGMYHLNLKEGSGSLGEGPDPTHNPEATLTLTFDDLQAMLSGRLMPYQAFMSGRLRVSGDMSTALKLDEVGKRVRFNKSLNEAGIVNV